MTNAAVRHIAFAGFGEAATAFLSGWGPARPAHVSVFDIKTDDPAARPGMKAQYAAHEVAGHASLIDALAGAEAVFSVVTADRALEAASAASVGFPPGALWLDCNSCSPETKRRAAGLIEQAGGRYADVAVMSPVAPKKHQTPLLVSGPHAAAAESVLISLGMKPSITGSGIGEASSVKMLRSVMIKGLEALSAECFLAARRAGVEEQVLASLDASNPEIAWRTRGAYHLERMMVHGARRAAEMREVVATLEELGLAGRMSAASAQWQDEIAALGAEPGEDDLTSRADRLLSRL